MSVQQQALTDELAQLGARVEALKEVLQGEPWTTLDEAACELLERQLNAMEEYEYCLLLRLQATEGVH